MRDWNLRPGDPLALTLAADFRLCTPDPGNDHIWEMEIGGGDPAALAVRTTFGLRARSMRIFPRFSLLGRVICDPEEFVTPPCLRAFAPNFLEMEYEPTRELHVRAETWVPDAQTIAGRLTIHNQSDEPHLVRLEVCGQLLPMEGEGLRCVPLQSVHVLSGRTGDLVPVIFLTGGPLPAGGPHPALALDLALGPGGERSLTWVEAALGTQEDSIEHARLTAARPWQEERAKLELVNQAETIEVECGDPDWEAAFALSQKQASGLFLPPMEGRQYPTFTTSRQPDQAWSPAGQGSGASYNARSPSAQDCLYMVNVLPGSPELAAGLVRNFLRWQKEDGSVYWKADTAGKQGGWLAAPLLAGLAWDSYQRSPNREFLTEVLPGLEKFLQCWLNREHDRDGDHFPEWDHPLQSGLEDDMQQTGGQAELSRGDITCVETPALGAMLYHEFQTLAGMARELGIVEKGEELLETAAHLGEAVEECWDEWKARYQRRDRDSHYSPAGKVVARKTGAGDLDIHVSFPHPTRLVLAATLQQAGRRNLVVRLSGRNKEGSFTETFSNLDFGWFLESGKVTSRNLFSEVEVLHVEGLEKKDRLSVWVMDFTGEDVSLFLPLWAKIPDRDRVEKKVKHNLLTGKHFFRLFGIPSRLGKGKGRTEEVEIVALPWNAMIAEGLAGYGMHDAAVHLLGGMMGAVVANLKQKRAFQQYYDARTGAGQGERNAVQGFSPLGSFLRILGVTISPPGKVILSGKNPFPWPVTVKYRGITVTRQEDRTDVTFPGGQSITLSDPTEAVVEAE
jgi:hypothetical protein